MVVKIGAWEPKCWGVTRCLSHNDVHSAHEMRTFSGYQCSRHVHDQRANSFFVDSGLLVVRIFDGDEYRDRLVHPGETFSVPSLKWHRFISLIGGTVYEFYWPDRGGKVLLEDIDRDQSDLGGRVDVSLFDF